MLYFSTNLLAYERWLTVGKAYWGELAPWSGAMTWGLLWTGLVLCAVGFRRHRAAGGRPQQLFGAALLLTFGLTVMAYILTPVAGLQWHLDTSLKRLLLQLTPLAMAWAVAGVGREPSRGSGHGNPRRRDHLEAAALCLAVATASRRM